MSKKIKSITIDAFRGYKNKTIFDFTVAQEQLADLVVIHAPNGFGKTSFFEAAEWCLTGELRRLYDNFNSSDAEEKDRGHTIKNRDSKKAYGEVHILSDSGEELKRQTGQSKKSKLGQRDYGYYKVVANSLLPDEALETFDVSSHILTQDNMDAFLRFTTPEERYTALEGFWENSSNVSEKYRKTGELAKKIQTVLDRLEEKKFGIEAELKNVILDYNELEYINSLINRLNGVLPTVEQLLPLTAEVCNEFLDSMTERTIKIQVKFEQGIESLNKLIGTLKHIADTYSKYIENQSKLIALQNDLNRVKKVYKELQKYDLLNKELEALNVTLLKENERKFAVQKLIKLFDSYVANTLALNKLDSEINEQRKQTIVLKQNEQHIEEKQAVSLKSLEEYKKYLDQYQKERAELNQIQVLVNSQKQGIESSKKSILELEKRLIALNEQKTKYINEMALLDVTIQADPALTSSIHPLFTSAFEQLHIEWEKLNGLQSQIQVQDAEYKAQYKLSTTLEQLNALGKSFVENGNLSTCPLCNHEFQDFEKLMDSISEQKAAALPLESFRNQISALNSKLENSSATYQTHINEFRANVQKTRMDVEAEFNAIKAHLSQVQETIEAEKSSQLMLKNSQQEAANKFLEMSKLEFSEQNFRAYLEAVEMTLETLQKDLTKNESEIKKITEDLEKANGAILKNKHEIELLSTKKSQLEMDPICVGYRALASKFQVALDADQVFLKSLLQTASKQIDEISRNLQGIQKSKIELETDATPSNRVELQQKIVNIDLKIRELQTVISDYESNYKQYVAAEISAIELSAIKLAEESNRASLEGFKKNYEDVLLLQKHIEKIMPNDKQDKLRKALEEIDIAIKEHKLLQAQATSATTKYREYIEYKIDNYFNATTINEIYQRIDPHPLQRYVKLEPEFDGTKTKLRVKTIDEDKQNEVDPILYNSSGQVSVLSLSIFLAKALQTEQGINTIFLDDPIQYLDAINILSFIDLLRTIITKFDRQLVISTHDKNFYQLLQKKLDPQFYRTKFIELKTYGTIKDAN